MYADLAPNTASAAVLPPTIVDNVQYTLLVHDEKMAEQRTLDSAGTYNYSSYVILISLGFYRVGWNPRTRVVTSQQTR